MMITPNSLLKMKVDFNKVRGYSIAAGMSIGTKKMSSQWFDLLEFRPFGG